MTDKLRPASESDANYTSRFGKNVRRLSEREGFSQRRLADISGVDHSTISRLISGANGIPSLDTAVKIGIGMGISPSQRLKFYESVLHGDQIKEIKRAIELTPVRQRGRSSKETRL